MRGGRRGPAEPGGLARVSADEWRGIGRMGLGVGVSIGLGAILMRPRLLGRSDFLVDLTIVGVVAAVMFATGIVLGHRRGIAWVFTVLIGLAGIGLRLGLHLPELSDVLDVTEAAIARWLAGGAPYGLGYDVSIPPGSPFPYGPVALLWYLPFNSALQSAELATGIAVLTVLVLRGRPVGAAAYALSPLVAAAAVDGSNDTSAGLFLLVALLALGRLPLVGGVLLALAAGFKLFAAAWLLPAVMIGGWRVLGGFGLGSAIAWGPAALAWGVAPIISSLRRALYIQPDPAYSLAALVEAVSRRRVSREVFLQLRLIAGAGTAVAVLVLMRIRRVDLTIAGLAIFIVTIYSGYWASHAYLVMAAPVVCWELDRWLGTAGWTVRWPLSPLRRLADRLGAVRVGPAGD